MPRVMIVVPQYPYPVVGGLERQAHELAKALQADGVSVQALSGRLTAAQPELEAVEGVFVHRIPWSSQKWWRFLRTPVDLSRVLFNRRGAYDVIHLHQHSWFGLFTILAARLLGKPILTKLPNVGEQGIPGLRAQPLGKLKLEILLQSDGLVAMSRESLDELQHVGFPAGRILATPNGIRLNTDRAVDEEEAAVTPSLTGCKVVFVGRVSEDKRISTLLAAWRRVVEVVGSSSTLEIWGNGPQLDEMQRRCHELSISNSVVFRGHVDGVRDQLITMDLFVLPSCVEGNSNAILEAMDAGLPIVSTRVGGTPMLVGEKGAPFLFEVDDQDALATHLITLIQQPALRHQVGAAMRRRAEVHFDIHKVARTYAAAYRCLVKGQRGRLGEVGGLPDSGWDDEAGR